MDNLLYFFVALKAAFLSSGGLANLPSLQQDFVLRGWASNGAFATSVSIGQIAPGPTGLWVVALGYITNGMAGAALMLIAIAIPPLLIIPIERLRGRVAHHPVVIGFARGLTVSAASTVPAVVIFRVLVSNGSFAASLIILGLAVALSFVRRVSPLGVVAIGAVLGAALFRQ